VETQAAALSLDESAPPEIIEVHSGSDQAGWRISETGCRVKRNFGGLAQGEPNPAI
jgi:hypothetical protein